MLILGLAVFKSIRYCTPCSSSRNKSAFTVLILLILPVLTDSLINSISLFLFGRVPTVRLLIISWMVFWQLSLILSPTKYCDWAFANLFFAKATATGSNIEVPKVVFRDYINEYRAILSLPNKQ